MPWVPQSTLFRKPGGREAFVIEDNPKIRAFIAKVLLSSGFSAHQFSQISELEAALTVLKPDVIVLDLSLGDSDAVEVMRSLAAVRYHGKVLLMSGHGLGTIDDVRLIGSRLGLAMLPPLHKPFRLEDLKARLSGVSPIEIRTNGSLLDLGLQNNWLELWYQPKIDLKSMLVCGAEALIRLRHPKDGILDPAQFLPPAGDPLYKPLSDFVVRRALADWRCLAAEQITIRLAINIPAPILQCTEFVVNLRRHIPQQTEFPGLIVEITENEAIADPDVAREVAVQLKLYNILLAIDDF
ncbi:MAG TPA: EAL domain-containing response regulator, partial [Nitrospira sp.]|nr:EAL domain-containing response regulator [Nitrospira sp.]